MLNDGTPTHPAAGKTENRRRGRDVFHDFRRVLRAGGKMLAILPTSVLDGLWTAADASSGGVGLGIRYMILRARARECGDNVYVGRNVEIRGWSELRVGTNVSIQRGCYIDATGGITIGNDVSIAHQCSLLSTNHSWSDSAIPIRDNPSEPRAVVIHDDVWIGCACRIMPGVEINSRSVVAAGAVVSRPVPAHTLVAGVPARAVKKI